MHSRTGKDTSSLSPPRLFQWQRGSTAGPGTCRPIAGPWRFSYAFSAPSPKNVFSDGKLRSWRFRSRLGSLARFHSRSRFNLHSRSRPRESSTSPDTAARNINNTQKRPALADAVNFHANPSKRLHIIIMSILQFTKEISFHFQNI